MNPPLFIISLIPSFFLVISAQKREISAQKLLCGAGSIPHAGGSFFLYEKSGLRESDYLRGRRKEVCTDLPPPLFPPLKKPLKITGIQGESLPDAPPAAHLRIRRSRIPKCVVKQRTAETRGRASRSCPSQSPRDSDLCQNSARARSTLIAKPVRSAASEQAKVWRVRRMRTAPK